MLPYLVLPPLTKTRALLQKDDAKSLADCGVNATTSRVLVTKGAAAGGELAAQEARRGRLEKLKSVVEAMAARGDGQGLTDEREFVLANQAGETVQLAPEDRRALVTGLALHDRGRASMDDGDCASALDELLMADEAFSLCAPSLLESIDNVALLQLDLVWCCYKLQDTARLGVCRERLTRAAAGLRRAHGPNMERARLLHGSVSPAAAVYLRLEVLQGVVAYHMQEREAAAQHLATAQARWQQLQVRASRVSVRRRPVCHLLCPAYKKTWSRFLCARCTALAPLP